MKRITHFFLAALVSLSMFVAFPASVRADHQTGVACPNDGILGIPPWTKYLECSNDASGAIVDFHFPADLWLIVFVVFEILTRVAVFLAVGVIVYAGIKFTIAQGNPEKIQEAKTIIQDAIIGLVVAVLATAIISFVGNVVI